jgi:adenylate cyclase
MARSEVESPGKMRLFFTRIMRSERTLTLVLIGLVLATYYLGMPLLDQLERNVFDIRYRLRAPLTPSEDIALVVVDDLALEKLGRWPWPRTIYADLVNRLSQAGARVIAFDMTFLEPDTPSSLKVLDSIDSTLSELSIDAPKLKTTMEELRRQEDSDQALATAIETSKAKVVLGYSFAFGSTPLTKSMSLEARAEKVDRIRKSAYTVMRTSPEANLSGLLTASLANPPIKRLTEATKDVGFLTKVTDRDGAVRWAPLMIRCEDKVFPSLPVRAAARFLNLSMITTQISDLGVDGIRLGMEFIRTDEQGRVLINFPGPPGRFPTHSIADVVRGKFPEFTFQNKVVLIGTMASGIRDTFYTPMSSFHPSIDLQAAVLDNLLLNRALEKPSFTIILDFLAILGVGLLAAFLLRGVGALRGAFREIILAITYVVFNTWLFFYQGMTINLVYPLLCLTVVHISITISRYAQEEKERRNIEGAFGKYVAPGVIDQMMNTEGGLELGGEERILTVLFSDLAGFTTTAEHLPPREVVGLMSEYFEEMTEKVYDQNGLLKEYVGDEIMAIFGAPLPQPDHASRACRAALRMRSSLALMRMAWGQQGRPALRARWGVNSGKMLVGNLGSSYRFSYGVIGDAVNLGSRLESLNKQYGTEILVGEETIPLLGENEFVLREVDKVQVKGKKIGISVYELVAESKNTLTEEKKKSIEVYAAGLEAYRNMAWYDAMELFGEVLELVPGDGPATILQVRSEQYRISPPDEDWGGIYEAKTK